MEGASRNSDDLFPPRSHASGLRMQVRRIRLQQSQKAETVHIIDPWKNSNITSCSFLEDTDWLKSAKGPSVMAWLKHGPGEDNPRNAYGQM